jgi:hypothetical protein
VTDTLLNVPEANARQTSEEPLCPLALTTKVQAKPPPVIPVTVVFGPDDQSVEMKANSNSLPEVVEKAEVTTLVLALAWSTETFASTDIAAKPVFVAARRQLSPKSCSMKIIRHRSRALSKRKLAKARLITANSAQSVTRMHSPR